MTAYGRLRQPGKVDAAALAAYTYRETVLLDSPTSLWPINGRSGVDVVSARNLTFAGSVVSADGGPFGPNMAAAFSSGYGVTVATTGLNTTGDVTFEVWAQRSSGSSLASPLSFGPLSGNPVAYAFDTYGAGGSNNRWRAQVGNGSGNAHLEVSAASNIVTGQWYHLVGVISGSTLLFYIDGVLVGTDVTPAGTRYSGSLYVHAARYNATYAQYLSGSLANIAFYNSTLSADRVAAHYAARLN